MKHRNEFRLRPAQVALTVVLTAAALGGCDDYLDRRDTLTLGVGDAVEVNKATQTINRWPETARRDRWYSDGERAQIAVERYRTRSLRSPLKEDGGSAASGKPGP